MASRHRCIGSARLHFEPLEDRSLLSAAPIEFGNPFEAWAQVRLQIADLAGKPIASTPTGSEFTLQAWVKDTRGRGDDGGVFAAYLDVAYDAALAQIDRGLA